MRHVFPGLITLSTIWLSVSPLAAQPADYPNRPIMVIVPFAAGGTSDVLARVFADRLSQRLGQRFVVENRTGVGGNIGVGATARSQPDGYTIGVATVTIAVNPHLYKEKMPFDPLKDLTPLYLMAKQPNVLVVHPSIQAKTVDELVEYLKANPDKASFGTSGVGTSQYLCMEMLTARTGVKFLHVAYRGSNQIMQDVLSGHVMLTCDTATFAVPQVKSGTVRAVAVGSLQRISDLPDVPTFAETLRGFEIQTWFGFVAPVGIDARSSEKLISALSEIGHESQIIENIRQLSAVPGGLAAHDFGAFIRAEFEKWRQVIEQSGMKLPN